MAEVLETRDCPEGVCRYRWTVTKLLNGYKAVELAPLLPHHTGLSEMLYVYRWRRGGARRWVRSRMRMHGRYYHG